MDYNRVIIDLLDRICKLEERVEKLEKSEKLISENESSDLENEQNANLKKRDKTRYIIDGRVYLKNRLVLDVVNRYVIQHPLITFDELHDVFFDKLQGSFGVVRKKSDIEPLKQVRYFYKDEETITLQDGTEVVVSNQWGKDNIKDFITYAKTLNYKIEELI